MSLSTYAFFIVTLKVFCGSECNNALYTQTFDTAGGWEGRVREEDFQDGPVFCFNYALSCSCLQSVQTVLTGQDSA